MNRISISWRKLIFIFAIIIPLGITTGIIITKVVVQNKKKIKTPEITGINVVDALEKVNKDRLMLEISDRVYDSAIPIDYIISQNPEPGEEVKTGRIIKIVVSRGMKQTIVPNVENTFFREAQGFLRKNGWTLGRISFIPSFYVDEGKIIAQTPLPDTEVLTESKISLLISNGLEKRLFYMPDLIGKNIEEVKKIIENLELNLGEIKEEENNDWDMDIVLDQNPPAGWTISQGGTVDIKVNIKIKEEIKGKRMAIVSYVVPAGFIDRQMKILVLDETGSKEILDKIVKPKEDIKISIQVIGEASVQIYLDEKLVEDKEI